MSDSEQQKVSGNAARSPFEQHPWAFIALSGSIAFTIFTVVDAYWPGLHQDVSSFRERITQLLFKAALFAVVSYLVHRWRVKRRAKLTEISASD